MFVNNVVVNGVALKVAFVRSDENGVTFTGMTGNGENFQAYFQFVDGVQVNFGVADVAVAPVKKERKPRKTKAQPEVIENAPDVPAVEMATDAEYAEYLTQNRRGRPSKKIAAYKAAHNL